MGYFGICPLLTSGAGLDKAGTGPVGERGPMDIPFVEAGVTVVVVVVVLVVEPLLEL